MVAGELDERADVAPRAGVFRRTCHQRPSDLDLVDRRCERAVRRVAGRDIVERDTGPCRCEPCRREPPVGPEARHVGCPELKRDGAAFDALHRVDDLLDLSDGVTGQVHAHAELLALRAPPEPLVKRGIDDPEIDRLKQARRREMQELAGKDLSVPRMLPAHERFDPPAGTTADVDDGLVLEQQLPVRERGGQVALVEAKLASPARRRASANVIACEALDDRA